MDGEQDDDLRLKFLRSLDLFRGVGADTLRSVARNCVWSKYEAAQPLFSQADECNSLLMISEGRVSLSLLSRDGRELVLAEVGTGDPLGDIELVLGCGWLSNGSALGPVRALSLRRAAFDRLLQDSAFASAMLQAVCARWCQLARFAETMALNSLEQRLASLLLDLCREHGRQVEGGTLIDHAISQTRMAQLINASRPKVNVQLRFWVERGVIAARRNRIVVRNVGVLRSVAAVREL